jgi:hypothetical protein
MCLDRVIFSRRSTPASSNCISERPAIASLPSSITVAYLYNGRAASPKILASCSHDQQPRSSFSIETAVGGSRSCKGPMYSNGQSVRARASSTCPPGGGLEGDGALIGWELSNQQIAT